MNRLLIALVSVFALVNIGLALDVTTPQNFKNDVNFEGPVSIDGTVLNVTASELNLLDGGMAASKITAGTVPSTAGAIEFGTNVTVQSRLPVLGKNSGTTYVIESGTATGAQLVVFTTAFSAAPVILLTPTNLHAVAATNLYATSANPRTNFVTLIDNPGFNWIAIGAK